jgi:HSP20 family protein
MLNELMPAGRRFGHALGLQHGRRDTNYDFDPMFGGALRLAPRLQFPLFNIFLNAHGAVLTAEIPGIDAEKLDIAVHQDTVTLKGSRELDDFGPDAVIHRQERPTGSFTRTFVLSFLVDSDKVVARFERGVLRLELPRPEADKPKQIKVTRG